MASRIRSVILFGGSGLLGGAFLRKFQNMDVQIHAPPSREVNIVNFEDVNKYLTEIKPDVVVNCAAVTDLDDCEVKSVNAYKVNAIGAYNTANASYQVGSKYVFISSTGIYGEGKEVPYTENDEVKPTNIHHKSKYAAEEYIREIPLDYLILRVGWLFGACDKQMDFVKARLSEAEAKHKIMSNDEQIGNPTFTDDVVEQAILLLHNDIIGTFNCVNNGERATRKQYVEAIFQSAGFDILVHGVPGAFFKRKVVVSNNESAINFKLSLLGLDAMPHWKDSLKLYTHSLSNDKWKLSC
jgi:dTDP-4-dehydrorhamnose reductase